MRRLLLPSLVAALLLSALPLTGSGPASAAAPTASAAERWALVVGITDYSGRTHSTVAGARDAGLVKNVLLAQGWKSDHIRVLTEGRATAQAVSEGLTWLVSKSSPSTFTMFHYSGHVKQTSAGEYLWPYDNRFLRDVDVARVLRGLQGTSWVDIAGCESAGFQQGLATPDRLFTSSSRVDEKSYESPQWGESVWAGLLFDQGIRDKKADSDHDRKVSVQEAYQWATPRAAAITAKQRPHGPQHPHHAGFRGSLNLAHPRTLR